jgi:hypothetical protein
LIAAYDDDLLAAVRAPIDANSLLEAEMNEVYAAMLIGYGQLAN